MIKQDPGHCPLRCYPSGSRFIRGGTCGVEPGSATESDEKCAVPGYVEYGISHRATLKIDIEQGRFVFFFTPIE